MFKNNKINTKMNKLSLQPFVPLIVILLSELYPLPDLCP
jgi:hypothetical protein